MRLGRGVRLTLIALLGIIFLKAVFDLSVGLPLLGPRAETEPPMSFTESLPDQDLALLLARPAEMSPEQWLAHAQEPLTRDELVERLQATPDEDWIGQQGGTVLALLVPPYARGDDFAAVDVVDSELASTLSWEAANDYGWHVFLVDCEANWIKAHVTVEVTRDTPHEVVVLHTRNPWAK